MHCPGMSLLCFSFLSARFPTKLSSPVSAGSAAPSQLPLAAMGYFRGRGKLGHSPVDRLSRSAPGGSRAGSPSHTCRCLLPPAAPETDADGGLDPSDQTRAPSPRAEEGQMRSSRARSALAGMLSQLQKPAPVQIRCLQPPRSSGGAVPGSGSPRFLV